LEGRVSSLFGYLQELGGQIRAKYMVDGMYIKCKQKKSSAFKSCIL
jgi:hypothetical protein